jgi:hypothetical protein
MLLRIILFLAAFAGGALPCSVSYSKAPYHKDRRSDTGLFRFEKDGHAGFINAAGRVLIPPRFDIGWFAEEDFVEGLSPARQGDNWGFIDKTGHWAVPPRYWRVDAFSEGLAAVVYQIKGYFFPAAYIDRSGKVVIDFPEGVGTAGPFSEGLAAVGTNGKAGFGRLGYIDRSGKFVIPYELALAGPFHNGLAAVVFDGQCYIEARDGSPRSTPPSVTPASSCGGVPDSITEPCAEGFIDKTGQVVFRFQGVRNFSEGMAAVEKDGKWGFIESDGRFRVPPAYESVRSFSESLAAARSQGKWGYINPTGQWIIPPQYATADDFSDDLALTDKGYIDNTGHRVALAKDGTAFVQGLAHVTLGDRKYAYLNHLGKIVFQYRSRKVKPSMLPYSTE